AEPQGFKFDLLTNAFCRARTVDIPLAVCVSTPPACPNSPPAHSLKRAQKKHCAAQAEYGRLAAQAYSPSDAMSQAKVLSGWNAKGSTPGTDNSRAETRRCGGRICR